MCKSIISLRATLITFHKRILFSLLFLFLSIILFSQDYYYELNTIPLKGELANFSGQCMLQDSEGFMWFGSLDGLYRYDGSKFKVFRNELDDSTTISYNMVFDLLEDRHGDIWVATESGLNRFNKKTETFTRFYHNQQEPNSILADEISCLAEDKNGTLWVGTYEGFCKFNRDNETFTSYRISSWFPDKSVYIEDLSGHDTGYLWISSMSSKYRFDINAENLEYMGEVDFPIFREANGSYIVDFWNSEPAPLKIQQDESVFINPVNQIPFKQDDITYVYCDKLNNIWIKTNEGLQGYDQDLNLIFHRVHLDSYNTSHHYNFAQTEFEDKNGSIWYYTLNGINQVIRKKRYFQVYDANPNENDDFFCLTMDNKNNIWAGTDLGVYKLDRDKNSFTQIFGTDYKDKKRMFRTKSIYCDNNNIIWAGMAYMGIVAMDTLGNTLNYFRPNWEERKKYPENSKFYSINKIIEDHEGRIWFCSYQSKLCFFDRKTNKMVFIAQNTSEKGKTLNHIISLYERDTGTYYAAGQSAMYKIKSPFKMINDTLAIPFEIISCRAYNEDGEEIALKGNFLCFSQSGDIWMTSLKNGLHRLTPRSGGSDTLFTLKKYTIKDGLPDNSVTSIIEDSNGNIWMGTHGGLSKFDYNTESFTNFYSRHGLPANYMHNNAILYKNKEIYMGSRGLVTFNPDSIQPTKHISQVKITELKIDNQTIQPGTSTILNTAILYTDSLDLKYNQNNLSFSYTLLNFIAPELNQYKYKLEGFHNDWVYAGNRTNVDFTNLKPGEYRLKVIAANSEGVWNTEGDTLYLTIKHPPWLTWYAFFIYVLLLTGTVIWIWRYRTNRFQLKQALELERLEKEKVSEIEHLKSRFFANISHEFRTPLTLIRGPLDDLKKQNHKSFTLKKDLLDIMHRNTIRLQTLINQVLDISKLETGKIRLQVAEGNIEGLLRTVFQSFLSLAESRKIDYQFQLQETEQKIWFDSDKIEKILINLISNAFKFTPEQGRITIHCNFDIDQDTNEPQYINIAVSDSGIGIPSDKLHKVFDRFFQINDSNSRIAEGTGIGLALTKELVELYHGTINAESTENRGTTFYVHLPVAKEIFMDDELVYTTKKIEQVSFKLVDNSNVKPIPKTSSDKSSSDKKHLILIVEDNTDLANYISGILANDYNIVSVKNGHKGYEEAKASIPDLVISDLMMPEIDGMEMCHLIRKDETTCHIPIIMLTAKADKESKLEGLQNGADDYIIKPFDAEELKARVKNLIDQRNRLIEKFRREWLPETRNKASIRIKDRFIDKLMALIEKHYSEYEFCVNDMAKEMNMSRAQFYRKITALTGDTPNELLRLYRIQRAAVMIRSGEKNISEIIYEVGFKNTSHFANAFKKVYGKNPSEYRNAQSKTK